MLLLIYVAYWAIRVWVILIFVWAILSWFHPDPRNPLVRIVDSLVEPIMLPFQKLIPPIGGLSLAPLVAVLVLGWISEFFLSALTGR
ncbi:MAG TPA: YggT family protein [Holophagaceae bacterium]|jgi:YggT family protein|nr:YggT family protein [Holophagaceae bacterium]